MAELGWVGILIPEAYGGSGLGLAALVVILETLGRSLVPAPFLSTVLLGGQLQIQAGSAAQQQAWLPEVAAGNKSLERWVRLRGY
jgi:acyl-CoA dehydrogenase